MTPQARPPDPRSQADVGRMQLGRGDDVLPPELAGVRLGMGAEEIRKLRQGVFFTSDGEVALEDAPATSLYAAFSYHFRKGKLTAIYLTLRHVEDLSDDFLAKAREKWGPPSESELDRAIAHRYEERGERVVSWRLPHYVVQAQKVKHERHVRIYVTAK
jgi:hypothetical protein